MNDFNRCNKVTGIHWIDKPMENVQIKVKLKSQDGILSLPKFEDYTSDSNSGNLKLENKIEEYTFKWQEKVFSSWELQRYSDIHNCISDTELNYHDMIQDLEFRPSKIFTYIHEDHHLPLPSEKNRKLKSKLCIENLNSCLERLNLNDRLGIADASSMGHLFRSEENVAMEEEQWIAMHVIFDNSEYNEHSQLLLKQEATLLSIYHNVAQNFIIISPDINELELNPYVVETATAQWGYKYAVELRFEDNGGGDELLTLLHKLYKKWEKKQKQLVHFVPPPLGKRHHYLMFEIVTTSDFEIDNLYVEFDIKIPEGVECSEDLHGRTHISKSVTGDACHFGHIIELNLEVAVGSDAPPLHLYFEVISTDWWGRHRTEGYAHLSLSLTPGRFYRKLSCSRPEEMNSIDAESRRFFVGGCHLIKDLEILAKPQLQDAKFKYTSTGTISTRWSSISSNGTGAPSAPPSRAGTSSASAVLLAAEAVLCKYRKASARLKAATSQLNLHKLYKKWEKKQKQLVHFVPPPLGKRHHYLMFEIVTTSDFEIDNLYVEFDIKIPEGVECSEDLHGRTHISKSVTGDACHFGHIIELNLEVAVGSDAPPLHLYFEVISTDWWGRHRTEGYAHLSLSLTPGRFYRKLSCSRPEEMNSIDAESRRFFVGGCHLIKDLEILAKPQLQDAKFKYTSTGTISTRWSSISSNGTGAPSAPPSRAGTSSASAVLLAAEAVLCKYRKASARLKAATSQLNVRSEDEY